MTALNMFVQPQAGAAYLLTDAATVDLDGTILRIAPKILFGSAPAFAWALGTSGHVPVELLADELGGRVMMDEGQLSAELTGALRRSLARVADARRCATGDLIAMVVGGYWCGQRRAPFGFLVTSSDSVGGHAADPFEFYWTDDHITAGPGGGVSQYLGRQADTADPASFDPQADGLRLIEAQRAAGQRSLRPEGEAPACRIGGMAHLTRVGADGISIVELGTWPDRIGERINPAARITPAEA